MWVYFQLKPILKRFIWATEVQFKT